MLPCICNMGFTGLFCQNKKQNIWGACFTVNCGHGICENYVRLYRLYSVTCIVIIIIVVYSLIYTLLIIREQRIQFIRYTLYRSLKYHNNLT